MSTTTGFIILAGNRPWFSSGNTDGMSVAQAPVGKGKGPKKNTTKTRAASKIGPSIVYPIFAQASDLTTDPYWKSIFTDAASNSFPRGFRYSNGILTYKIRSKIYECLIPQDCPQIAMDTVRQFMGDKAGIMSINDTDERKRELEGRISDLMCHEVTSWSEIRTASQKSIIASKFVEQIGSKYNMSLIERTTLECLIGMGIGAGYFNADNIEIQGGLIIKINGLLRDPETGSFYIDPNLKPKARKVNKGKKGCEDEEETPGSSQPENIILNEKENKKPKIGYVDLSKQWKKLIESVHKKSIIKNNTTQSEISTPLPSVQHNILTPLPINF